MRAEPTSVAFHGCPCWRGVLSAAGVESCLLSPLPAFPRKDQSLRISLVAFEMVEFSRKKKYNDNNNNNNNKNPAVSFEV